MEIDLSFAPSFLNSVLMVQSEVNYVLFSLLAWLLQSSVENLADLQYEVQSMICKGTKGGDDWCSVK